MTSEKANRDAVSRDAGFAPSSVPSRVFDAALPFPHRPPYDIFFAERIPLLYAFRMAVNEFRLNEQRNATRFQKIQRAIGLVPEHLFVAAECGVYTGSSLLACANLARDLGANFHFFGLDTFEGLPPLSETDLLHAPRKARYKSKQLFGDTSVERIGMSLREYKLEKQVTLIKGLFSKTLRTMAERKYHWVNIDCDLYEPHLECLEYFYPRMARGGVVFFDDFHSVDFPMAAVAINEFMSNKPEQLTHLRYGAEGPNRLKAFFVKE